MTQDNPYSRRSYLKAAGVVGAAALAGCSSEDDEEEFGNGDGNQGGNGGNGDTPQDGNGDQQAEEGELEIIHWWTAGGEQEALEALLEGFQEEYPDVEVVNNPAPGGAGSALDAVVQNRVIDGNPPSTFQIWPGQSLTPYTDADLLEDIGHIWEGEMEDAYLDGVKEAAAPAGNYVSVPINIHRLNNLFYNVEVVEQAGVDPATIESPGDLTSAMQTVAEETDATPMAHQTQSPWSSVQLWETVFVGEQSADDFMTLIEGNVEEYEGEVKNALQHLVDYSEFYPEDAGSISWDQGNSQVINGNAAFIHQGDWAAGQYEADSDFEFGSGWDMVPFPGTEGTYSIVMDSFVMPTENPSPEETEKFLTYCGTTDAQERFNAIKGSIPPRTDASTEEFSDFLQRQSEDFAGSDSQPTTIAHGSAVPPAVKSDIEEAFAAFNENGDIDQAYQGIRDAF